MAPSHTARAVTLLVAIAAGATAVVWQLRRRAFSAEAQVVEVRAALDELLSERGAPAPAPAFAAASYPPPVVREPLDEATARRFFRALAGTRYVFDERLVYRCASNLEQRQELAEHQGGGWWVRTNSLGMREDGEPSARRPDLRVLAAGASNVEGMCANGESAVNVLEAALRERFRGRTVEALNAGVGSSHFYNYLLVIERYVELAPDVFAVVIHGGTDFSNGLGLQRYFERRGPWQHTSRSCEPLARSGDPFVRQLAGTELGQVQHMAAAPADERVAIDWACSLTAAIQSVCEAHAIRFVCVYLPPPLAGQPELLARERAEAMGLLELTDHQIATSDRIADGWLAFLRERGIAAVDLRPVWRASSERLYWRTDTHVNLAGQRAIADALLALIAPASTTPDGAASATARRR